MAASEPRVVDARTQRYDVYIGRPSIWGNPFSHKPSAVPGVTRVATRTEAVARYEEWLLSHPSLLAKAREELRGKVLGCPCGAGDLPCHGEVLLRLANGQGEKVREETTLEEALRESHRSARSRSRRKVRGGKRR